MDYYSIPPFAHLDADKNCEHYLTVAQWVEQEEALLSFFRKRSDEGAEIILDNGVFEFREAYPVDNYLDMADDIGATMIVAPDEWKNAKKTRDMIHEFIDSLSEKDRDKFLIMGVPHGKTLEEFLWCYGEICTDVDLVGLAKDEWGDKTGYIRPFFTWHLEREQVPIKYHLLGLTHVKELAFCNPHKVASFDTSMPYKLGLENTYLHEETTIGTKYKPEAVLDEFQLEVSVSNCNRLRELAQEIKQNLWKC